MREGYYCFRRKGVLSRWGGAVQIMVRRWIGNHGEMLATAARVRLALNSSVRAKGNSSLIILMAGSQALPSEGPGGLGLGLRSRNRGSWMAGEPSEISGSLATPSISLSMPEVAKLPAFPANSDRRPHETLSSF